MGQTHRQEYRGYTIMAYQVASEGFARYSFHIMEGDRLCYAAKPEDQRPSCRATTNIAKRLIDEKTW
ncbi:hypothetical protein [Limnoraphis robusta]|uniref:CpcD n=1 Tax=Limnoraphis robusta CCNP1315 TaxID=3110306 RepID=A0ABU5U2F4_9CYAN|nr:hypothetical protein [Limnoraphis robusta]MEA5521339.1 hypothetical protein [Limnoraphis robusta CCNP1315]MEA5548906.1 hypothetical protein [Limnoraphis robusta CCNP1324]